MKNGLYSIHVTLLDGRVGKGSGVILFRDGQILGGDAYLFYTGSYTVKGDTFKGEVLVQRHTSSPDANPLFGGPTPVGIGVSGTFTDTRATMNGTALVGQSQPDFRRDAAHAGRYELRAQIFLISTSLENAVAIPPPAPAALCAAGSSGSACRRPARNRDRAARRDGWSRCCRRCAGRARCRPDRAVS